MHDEHGWSVLSVVIVPRESVAEAIQGQPRPEVAQCLIDTTVKENDACTSFSLSYKLR